MEDGNGGEGNGDASVRLDWRQEGVAQLTLDRPDSFNRLTDGSVAWLEPRCGEAAAGGARAVIVTGSGPTCLTDPERRFPRASLAVRDDDVAPIVVAETRRALYRCQTATADEADRAALDAAAASGPDWWEGAAAFAGKRAPNDRRGE